MIPSLFLSEEKIDSRLEKHSREREVSFASVNLEKLKLQLDLYGERTLLDYFLTEAEKKRFASFVYEKRKVEWLAGRIAAKHAAIKFYSPEEEAKEGEWQRWEVATEEGGRPFLVSRHGIADISISHSASRALAMAVSRGTCGIDIQKITSKIIKVEQKFVDYLEKDFNKCACLAALPEKIFLTLVWSAKEALRKGSGHKPVIGFMEIKLCNVSGDRDTGFVFQFTCDRSLKGSQRKKRFTTWQNICDDFVVAFVRGENSCPEEEKST